MLQPAGATSPRRGGGWRGYGGSACTAAVPSLRAKGCSPFSEHLWKAPVKHFLGAPSPRAVAITAGAPGQPAAERNPQRSLAEYHGAGNCAVSWSRQAPSLELCLSHYYASTHFALFTFLLFKEITLKCACAGSTFAFLELSIDLSSNCLQLP